MKKFLKSVFSKGTKSKTDKKNQESSRSAETRMSQVIQRVDKQIGRAVTRLADR
jgi:tetrahydromethanopterin S-methyltransferase subunit G